MHLEVMDTLDPVVGNFVGYIYPNEQEITWGLSIVTYPFVAGIVSGAFMLSALVRIFDVSALQPVNRLSQLVALAFLIVAPLPLLSHLGHPWRGIQVLITPSGTSPMAVFGFVYVWLLSAVVFGLWVEYRKHFVEWSKADTGFRGTLYRMFTFGDNDISGNAKSLNSRLSKIISVIGIPAAVILPGYVGFIFSSIQGNPLWENNLLPVKFVLSAIVSGIALCLILFTFITWMRRLPWNEKCMDTMARLLFYLLLLVTCMEAFHWINRLTEMEESSPLIRELALGEQFIPLVILQGILGSLVPLVLLGIAQIFLTVSSNKLQGSCFSRLRLPFYLISCVFILVGVLAMRWNVVIGGQLFSKSARGLNSYSLELYGHEGLLTSTGFLILPFLILWIFIRLFLSENLPHSSTG